MPWQPKILWSERDAGQKLSIVMFGLLTFLATGFMVVTGVQAALKGEWGALVAPAGFLLISVSLWMEWRRRNARR